MKVVVQRVLNSSVVIDDKYEEKINKGLMILLGMIFKEKISSIYDNVKFGKFGSDMKVSLINDGPITIIIESREKVKK